MDWRFSKAFIAWLVFDVGTDLLFYGYALLEWLQ